MRLKIEHNGKMLEMPIRQTFVYDGPVSLKLDTNLEGFTLIERSNS